MDDNFVSLFEASLIALAKIKQHKEEAEEDGQEA